MLPGFERHTENLTPYEVDVLLPVMIKGFKTKIGKEMAVTNKQVVAALKSKGYKLSDVRVRKVVNHIRNYNLIPGLIASSEGYYVSNDPAEIKRYIESLDGREAEIRRIKQSFRSYLGQLLGSAQSSLKFNQ